MGSFIMLRKCNWRVSCLNAVRQYCREPRVVGCTEPRVVGITRPVLKYRHPSQWITDLKLYPELQRPYQVAGCDFNHWQVWPRPMKGSPSKDEIIKYYVSILAQVLGSDQEAIHKIYSVATQNYYAFGANVDPNIGDKILCLQNVCYVLPDAPIYPRCGRPDPTLKRYPWDPFINGVALAYDSKYYPHNEIPPGIVDEQLDRLCRQYTSVEADIGLGVESVDAPSPFVSTSFDWGLLRTPSAGYDFEHWRIYIRPLSSASTKDDIIKSYIQILAQVLGSGEEAVKKIYSVATGHCYGFGANVSYEKADKIRGLENVTFVLPDSYLDPVEKRYPWEPFVDGRALV